MKSSALQTAIYGVLSGDATLVAALSDDWGYTAIFSDVPQENADNPAFYPFVSFGPSILSRYDDKGTAGASEDVEINVWSRSGDYIEVKAIAERIHDLLHRQDLSVSGANHIITVLESSQFIMDPDGETRRGSMSFRVVYQDS